MSTRLSACGFAAMLLSLTACGGGGSGESTFEYPLADAGSAQAVDAGATVTLDGTRSKDPDGAISTYGWTQTSGIAVTLSGASTANPNFTAPVVGSTVTLRFALIVTDNEGYRSTAATVAVVVSPPPGATVAVTGLVRFARVPFRTTAPIRLDYQNPVMQPARGVMLRALDAETQAVLAMGETSSTGTYSLTVPANTNIEIEVWSRMLRTGAPPNWDVRVQNGQAADSPVYEYNTVAFNSGVMVYDVDIPLGIGANGIANGIRASGPFAILDVIYQSIQTVIAVDATVNMPALYVDWGTQRAGSFFTTTNGQHIGLMSDLSENTDEFDRHVIAHEFGHYLETNFSRSDSIGGSHALGDRLDPRVAFSEGFAYAFAGIVLGDPLALDSFVFNGNSTAGGFNLNTNPPVAPPNGFYGVGCWCNESSMWSLIWDLYDSSADGADNVELGFAPLWAALTGTHRTGTAFTTIFSYISALKALRPAESAAIDTLIASQNIDSASINAYATTETHAPTNASTLAAIPGIMPVYANLPRNTPVVVRSTDDVGQYNKAGNRRYLRFTADATRSYTVTVTTSNQEAQANPDFRVRRGSTLVRSATGPANGLRNEVASFNATAGLEYVIDAYECANGCADPSGTPGDYDLTVVIN